MPSTCSPPCLILTKKISVWVYGRQIALDDQHHWCPIKNIDCKLGFWSSLCSAISFKFHHNTISQHHLCFVIDSFIFIQTIVHLITPSNHSPSHFPSNHSPSCYSNFLSCSPFSQLYLRKCFNVVMSFCSRWLNDNVEIRRFCIGWLPWVY